MEKVVKKMIEELSNFLTEFSKDNLEIALAAYNTHCDEELGGTNYIYDLRKKSDLVRIADEGITANKIASIILEENSHFVIYYNNDFLSLVDSDVINNIKAASYNIAESIVLFPYIESYKKIYERFVTK